MRVQGGEGRGVCFEEHNAVKINNMFLRHILENDAGRRLFILIFLYKMLLKRCIRVILRKLNSM